jgi:hypothetical protein
MAVDGDNCGKEGIGRGEIVDGMKEGVSLVVAA